MNEIAISYAAGYYGQTFEFFIRDLSKIGAKSGQIIPDQHPNLYSEFCAQRVEALAAAAEEAGVRLSIHNVFYDINPLSLIPAVVEFAIDTTRRVAELACQLGCRTMTLHPGYIFPGWARNPDQKLRFESEVQQKVARLVAAVAGVGLECRFENGSYFLSSMTSQLRHPFHYGILPEEMERILSASEHAFFCLDVGKVEASGLALGSFIERLGKKIREIQVSSIENIRDAIASFEERGLAWEEIDYVYEGRNLEHFIKDVSQDHRLARCGLKVRQVPF